MDVNANSQSSLSANLNHPQVAIAEELGNSSSIVGSTSEECRMSDNIHGSASDMLYDGDDNDSNGDDGDGDDAGDDDYDDEYNDLYDANEYDYMFYNSDDENNEKKRKVSDDDYLSMQLQFDNVDLPPGVEASVPDLASINTKASASRRRDLLANFSSNAKEGAEKELDAVQKYLTFKRFDIVDNISDHRYLQTLHGTQPTPAWKKKIQDEWKILQSNLPDTIYVRVCEGRMDLLRAVIIGPTGTPYHDGLFVFDVHFPSNYPSGPPLVKYHSGGLRINPNLYNCGKVCLSLLNTWTGQGNEKWLPDKSTILQVLVSIQALILNAEPYFNEPGYSRGKGNARNSKKYSEDAFILSLRTMMYTLKKPPKHFEDFVSGHFLVWGRVILIACRAYMEGTDVGSDVKGNIEDSGKGEGSQLQGFRKDVATILNKLVESFIENGSTDCEEFLLAD